MNKKQSKMKPKKNKKKQLVVIGIVVAILIAAISALLYFLVLRNKKEDALGEMQMGRMQRNDTKVTSFTEEGSISVGTVTQTFEMDLSEFTGSQTADFSWGGGMAMPQIAMGGMGQNAAGASGAAGNSGGSTSNRQLTVETLLVEVGQEVKAGDPILTVTQDTLETIRSELESDVTDAKSEYDQLLTQQKKTEKEALAALKENQLYGQYADTEYNLAIEELQEKVDELTASIEEKNEELLGLNEDLTDLNETLAQQQKVLENAEYIVEYEDRLVNTYSWVTGVNAKEDAETIIENLESEIENTEESILSVQDEIEDYTLQLELAQKDLESGKIDAESIRETRNINSENAQEIYDVKTELTEFEATNAKESYESAFARLEELDSYLADRTLRAAQDGVITEIAIAAGDSLSLNTELISLNNYSDITVTLTLDESQIELAQIGASAIVTVPAFPDEQFEAKVTEHGDAQIDSNTNTTTYEVTVTILENTSRLYEGMSAEVTFGGTEDETE